ncbi:hypothetical protein [Pelomonas sp. Root1444]|uniref:hypothetical protein n=1 Tax=Pelomonas sp. Root1444 TaxID=1736464 RepID=UPI00070256F7|nr:hypothetical protein [Pelomonas sp. Root1444]KQY82852.1 hypothetical protein ASD35_25155 [Pelomonas sp. Root1444]
MTLASLFHPALAGALIGLSFGASAAPAAPAAVAFDTAPRAGQHQRQLIDIQAVIKMRVEAAPDATDEQRAKIAQATEHFASMGPMKMKLQMDQTMKVGQPDADGWLPLTMTTGSKGGQIDVGGKVSPLPGKVQDLNFIARFNPKDFAFEIQNVQGAPELNDAMRAQGNAMIGEALQLYKTLAQQPLKVGESVDVPMTLALPIPMPGGAGSLQSKLRYTLARVDRGTAHFDLGMDMTMDVNAPLPPQAASAPAGEAASAPAADAAPRVMNVAMAGRGQGTSSLRLADRLPLASHLKMTMTMTMKMPDSSLMHMDMDMDVRAKGQSLAKPAPAKAAATKKN